MPLVVKHFTVSLLEGLKPSVGMGVDATLILSHTVWKSALIHKHAKWQFYVNATVNYIFLVFEY